MPAGPMAVVTGDNIAKKLWEAKADKDNVWGAVAFDPRFGFSGTEKNRMCVEKREFRQYGSQLTLTLVKQQTGDGTVDGAPIEGTAAHLATFPFTFEIHEQTAQPLGVKSEYSEQQTEWDQMETNIQMNREWWNVPFNTGLFMQLAGATFTTAVDYYKPNDRQVRAGSSDIYTGLNPVTAHTRLHRPGTAQGATADLGCLRVVDLAADQAVQGDDTAVFNVAGMDFLLATAKQTKPPLRQCRWAGGETYVLLVHDDQLEDLLDDTSYDSIVHSIVQGGLPYEQSTFATGNFVPYRGMAIVASLWNPPGQHSTTAAGLTSTRKAILGGAGAAACGFGVNHGMNRFKLWKGTENYGGQPVVVSRCMWGLERVEYNSLAYGCLAYTTYATNHGDT